MSSNAAIAEPEHLRASRGRRIGLSIAIAVAATAIAMLPGFLTGFALPRQPLSSVNIDGVTSLLPFSAERLTLLLAETTLAGALAGLAARGLRTRGRPLSRPVTVATLVLLQAAMVAQSTRALRNALPPRGSAGSYLALVTGTAVIGVVLGAVAFTLISSEGRAWAAIALSWAAVLTAPWISVVSYAFGGAGPYVAGPVSELIWWTPAVLGAAAIAWCGVRSVGRATAAVVSLAIIAIAPACLSVIDYVAGSAMYLHLPAEGIAAGMQVFPLMLTQDANLQRIAVTVVLAAIGTGLVMWRGGSSLNTDTQR